MVVAIVVIVVVLVLLVVARGAFNSLRKADQGVQKDWNNITTELERRANLVPNLVETVKQYAAHERGVLEEVTAARARAGAIAATPDNAGEIAGAQDALSGSLGRLLAVGENYPDLKASDNYRQLQAELTDTEDRIAASRKLYNSSVAFLNTKATTFPTNMFTGMARVTVAEYYQVSSDRMAQIQDAPDVKGLFD